MCTVKDKATGAIFDDWTEAEDGFNQCNTWTQACDECATRSNLPDEGLDRGAGSGICGVEGCNRESDHYYDFNREELS
jgi:hypothetical protein